MDLHIGCSGFPVNRQRYYKEFGHSEVQISFYQILTDERLKKWREQAPDDFIFNLKAFQGITHPSFMHTWRRANIPRQGEFGYFRPSQDVFWSWEQTLREARILKSKFILIQVAKSFRQTQENLSNIYNFFETIEQENFQIAIELRGWSQEWIYKLCRDFDLVDVVDLNRREPVWLGSKKVLYVRFHGTYDENGRIFAHYSFMPYELEQMADKVLEFSSYVSQIWINFNNTDMFANAKQFRQIISSKLGD